MRRLRHAWNRFAHGSREPAPDHPRFLSRRWWRDEVDTFVFAYALDRIRAPWRLTAAEWRMHAKLFAQNLAVIAVMVAIAYGIVALIFGRLAGMKAAGVVAFLPTPAAATRSRIQPMMALLGHATARAGRGRV